MPSIFGRIQNLFASKTTEVTAGDDATAPGEQRPKTEQETRLGRKGEDAAATFLKRKGFRILARNFSTPVGEIDLVARDKEFLVFVEVKSRASDDTASPEDQVNPHKMHQLTKAGKFYLGRYPPPLPPARFDVVSIVWPPTGQPTIKHIEHAFEATF
jgi:putative endonuclease